MDFIAIGCRNTPFIDGKTYSKMCFACFHTPQDEVQHYDANGNIESIEGPFYDHKHLKSPEELVNLGTVPTLEQAKRCVRGVQRKIKEAGVRTLNKLKLKRPKAEYEFNPEFEEAEAARLRKQSGRRKRR